MTLPIISPIPNTNDFSYRIEDRRRLHILVGYLMNHRIFKSDIGKYTCPRINMVTGEVDSVLIFDIQWLVDKGYLRLDSINKSFILCSTGFEIAMNKLRKAGAKITTDSKLMTKILTKKEIDGYYMIAPND